jgi:hypothetical protein
MKDSNINLLIEFLIFLDILVYDFYDIKCVNFKAWHRQDTLRCYVCVADHGRGNRVMTKVLSELGL